MGVSIFFCGLFFERINHMPSLNGVYFQCVVMRGENRLYRKHRSREESPREELEEDDHNRMVNTGLPDTLWLNTERQTQTALASLTC